MSILQTLCWTCFALSALFLIASVALFFVWDIRGVIYWVTGKQKKDSMKQMNDSYVTTGSLRNSTTVKSPAEAAKEARINEALTITDKIAPVPAATPVAVETQSFSNNANGFKLTKDILVTHTNEKI